jgi:hypothetical protein
MNPREYQVNKLKELQDELRTLNKQRNLLKVKIKKQVEVIDTIDNDFKLTKKVEIDYVKRDVDLCTDYINLHGRVYTAELIKYLNHELKDQHRRWKAELDSNLFMNYIGTYLKKYNIKYEWDIYNGRRTTVWLKS